MCWKLHAYIVSVKPKCHQVGLVCHLILSLLEHRNSENMSPLGHLHCLGENVLSSAVISGGWGQLVAFFIFQL